MATTYSQTATGYVVGGNNLPTKKLYDIPDLDLSGNDCTQPGGMQLTMRQGDLMLVKNPDGSQSWYRYDAERSTVANPILVAV